MQQLQRQHHVGRLPQSMLSGCGEGAHNKKAGCSELTTLGQLLEPVAHPLV